MSDANYRIRYKKGDFEVEVQGDKAWVVEKFEELKKDIPPKAPLKIPSGSQPSASTTDDGTLPDSMVEFIKAKGNPSKHTDRAVLFAYWLFKKEDMSSYNIADIDNCYDQTRIPKPANTSDIMNKIQAQGFVAAVKEEKDGKKAWVITQTGEKYVEQMSARAAGEQKQQKEDRRGGSRSSVVSPAIDELMAEGFLKDFKTADQVYAELKRKAVPVIDTHTVNEALKRRVPKTLDRIKGEQGKWVYRRKP
jgi:DNA-binding PadR family transcriptional regulator